MVLLCLSGSWLLLLLLVIRLLRPLLTLPVCDNNPQDQQISVQVSWQKRSQTEVPLIRFVLGPGSTDPLTHETCFAHVRFDTCVQGIIVHTYGQQSTTYLMLSYCCCCCLEIARCCQCRRQRLQRRLLASGDSVSGFCGPADPTAAHAVGVQDDSVALVAMGYVFVRETTGERELLALPGEFG